MNGLSEKQKLALTKYEKEGLRVLKNNPYGIWLDFLEN